MGRQSLVPDALKRGHFTVKEAQEAGLKRWHLQGASWSRLVRGSYVWIGADSTIVRLEAAWDRLPAQAAFSGRTAAWLHGIDVAACDPIEAIVPRSAGVSARAGISLHRALLDDRDVIVLRGMRTTTMPRTVFDICTRLKLTEAVVVVDAALHDRRVTLGQLLSWADAHTGRKGVTKLRQVLRYAEPKAESAMESRLRMVIVLGGLPRPKAQVSIRDANGRIIGRPDLYYEEARLGIEYDGGTHRHALVEDNRRQNQLLNAGVRLLRFTSADVGNPGSVVQQVRTALR